MESAATDAVSPRWAIGIHASALEALVGGDRDAVQGQHPNVSLHVLERPHFNDPVSNCARGALPGIEGAWIDYQPAEAVTSMFGGNSNWRGPIWMPLNYLAVRQFVIYQRYFGDGFKLEYPTGSGQQKTFGEIAQDISDRLVSIWLPDADGRRPVYGDTEKLWKSPAWKNNMTFNEYFHGDNGAGLGATHQTGWTGLVADLILDPPGSSRTSNS